MTLGGINMRVFFTILICKLLRFAGGLIGKGSSKPGQIALRLCPDVLSRVKLPDRIIAVTGSNGKTSTVEMIAHLLTGSGMTVAWNREGSNQIEGVTTMVLGSATLGGRLKADVLLIESDERFAKYTFKYIRPTHYVITNLYRDQLTRNGHPEWVYDALAASICPGTRLILNADDPLVSLFGAGRDDVIWFGADALSTDVADFDSVYDDGAYCPVCKEPMEYSLRHYNQIGHYHCKSCGYSRHDAAYTVTAVDMDKGIMEIDGKYTISLALKSIYNIYNILAAYTVARLMGVEPERIAADMSDYVLKNGRVITFTTGGRRGTLLAAKHENSIAYDLCLRVAREYKDGCDLMIIVDAVSRKYFTSDVSWLWDIDFESLNTGNVDRIILAGKYVNDLLCRFEAAGIDPDRISGYESIREAVQSLDNGRSEYIYALTCFSDKAKLLAEVNVTSEG